ncbi:MAG: PorV/PorQ family protein [Elusimicrobiota bacterium]
MRAPGLAVLLVIAAPASRAAETASFLNVGVGARALSMGAAYTAVGDDAHAICWNPAGLAALEKREVGVSHAELGQNTRHDFIAYAHPTSQGTLAGALTYLSQGALSGRDSQGRPTGNFNASDAAVSLGYGRKSELADFGAAVKYLRSNITSTEAQTVAVDLGARKAMGALLFGGALRNLGPGLKYDAERNDLPLRLALGAAYKLPGDHLLAAEFTNGPRGAGSDFGFGGEYLAIKDIFLRAGYTTQTTIVGGSGFDAARGLTLGLGLRKEKWGLDYAAVPMGELGNTHRFTLSARW